MSAFESADALSALRAASAGSEFDGKLFLVGGYVRDRLLGLPLPNDYDIVLEGDALKLATFFFGKGICEHSPVVYPRFGTAMVHVRGAAVELVSARAESYQESSRHPDVRPATLRDDALRRDFTVNTLMENLHTGELLDPLGVGLDDLRERRLRTPLHPEETFSDDPLRMLRAIRFSTKLGFDLEPNCFDAIKTTAERLKIISSERIRDELTSMATMPQFADAMRLMLDGGLLRQFAPEIARLSGVAQNEFHLYDVWEHTMKALDNLPSDAALHTILATLLHDIGKPETRSEDEAGMVHFFGHESVGAAKARTVMSRLRFPNDQIERVTRLVAMHMRPGAYQKDWSDGAVRRLLRDAGDLLDDLLALCKADAAARRLDLDPPDFASLEARLAHIQSEMGIAKMVSPLSGTEIMTHLGLDAGPEVGKMKAALAEAVIDGAISPGDKDAAYRALDELVGGQTEAPS